MKKTIPLLLFLLFPIVFSPFSQTTDPIVTISRISALINENGGSTDVNVSLSSEATVDTDVQIEITGSATINDDFSVINNTNSDINTITIKAGETLGSISVIAIDDSSIDLNQDIIIDIISTSSGSIGSPSQVNIGIKDDDLLVSLVKVSNQLNADTLYEETQNEITFRVQVNEPVTSDIDVSIAAVGEDFNSGELEGDFTQEIQAGTTYKTFSVRASDDKIYEDLFEIFYLKVGSITSGPGEIVDDSIKLVIKDNDPSDVTFRQDKTEIIEDGGEATIKALLQRPFDQEITLAINYRDASSTAEFGVDWESDQVELITIPIGDTLAEIKVSSIDDAIQDPNEFFYVVLNSPIDGSPPSVNISYNQRVEAKIFIIDDEIGPVANADTFNTSCVVEGNINVDLDDKTLSISNPADGLLANDTEAEGEEIKVTGIKAYPDYGTLYCGTTRNAICEDGTFRYVHNGNESINDQDQFSYRIVDEDGFEAAATVIICVSPDNDCPELKFGLERFDESETRVLDLLLNTTDPEYANSIDPVLKYRIDPNQPPITYGEASLTSDGKLTYTAPDYLSGSNQVSQRVYVEVEDGAGCIVGDYVPIVINNTVPQAVNDTFIVSLGELLEVDALEGLLANDPKFPGATYTASFVTTPNHSILDEFDVFDDGSFRYKHDSDPLAKEDVFDYRLTIVYDNGEIDQSNGQVVIKVNDCPVIEKDTYTIFENTDRFNDTFKVALGSTSPPWIGNNDFDINDDPLTFGINRDPADSTESWASIDSEGNLMYFHGGGEYSREYFLYEAFDGYCKSNVDTIFFNINPINDCPETLLNGYNSLSLRKGASIEDYISSITTPDGDPITIDSLDIVNGDTLYVYTSDGTVWVENMDEGGTLAIGAPGILNNDDDAEGDNLKTYFLLEANHPITTHPEYYDADGNWKYPYPPHAVSVDVFEDGSFEYVHDGSNGLRDVIYTKTCDEPLLSIETPTNKPCCTVDSIMLIFGPDNACGEGLPDYFTLEEGGTFVADTGSTGINEFMLGVTGTEYTGVFSNDFDEEGDSLVFLGISEQPKHGTIVGDTIYPDGSFTYIHDGFQQTTSDQFSYDMTDLPHSPSACATVTVYLNIIPKDQCPEPEDDEYSVLEGDTLIVSGVGGLPGNYYTLPGIMNNDSDVDLGTFPAISDNLIAYYPFNKFLDSIPGDSVEDGNGGFIATILAIQKAKDMSSNNYDGFLRGGKLEYISAPQPDVPDGKAVSPVVAVEWSSPPQYQRDRFIPAKMLNSYDYDGDTSYVEVEDEILDLSRDSYTISGWFYLNDLKDNSIFLNFPTNGGEEGLVLGIFNEKLSLGIGDGTSFSVRAYGPVSQDQLIQQNWHHFVLIKNQDNYKIYLDRDEIYSEDLNNSSLPSQPSKMFIGMSLSGNHFYGSFDDLHIIGDAVSEEEVLNLYYSLSTTLEGQPSHGDVEVRTDGSFTYIHDGVGGIPEDQFIYKLSDGICGNLATVKINVIQVNDCPIGERDTFNVDEGNTLTIDALSGVLINDTDEEMDPLTSTIIDKSDNGLPRYGIISMNSDGSFEYIHDDSETLVDSLQYIVSDGDTNCSDTVTVLITINPVPDCPIPSDDTYVVTEGGTLNVDTCITQYTDPGTLYTNWESNEPNNLDFEDYAEIYPWGTWNDITATPTKKYLLEMESGVGYVDDHTYLGSYDGHSYFMSIQSFSWQDAKSEAEVEGGYLAMIKSEEENNAIQTFLNERLFIGLYQDPNDPYFENQYGGWKWVDGSYLYNEGESFELCGVLINDDIQGGDTLFVSDHDNPVNGSFENNEILYNGNFVYNHDGSQDGDTILYKIKSDLCESDIYGKIIIEVENVNDCPVAVRDTFYVDEGGTLDTVGLLLNDYDVDGDLDLLRAQKDPSSTINHGLSVNIYPEGRLLYTHDGSENFLDSVQYRAYDLDGCDSLATAIIIINPVNDLPIAEEDSFEVYEGESITIDVLNGLLSNDTDADGDDLKVMIVDNVSVGVLLPDPSGNGSFTYTHDGSDTPNEVCFTYIAYDGNLGPPPGFSEETEVCITIKNRLPVCDGEEFIILENEVLTTDLTNGVLSNCTDPDPQDILTVILDTPPTNGAFVLNDDGTFTYDHDCSDDPDETFFTYFVTDGEDTTKVSDTTRIIIENECPVGNDDLYSGVDEGNTLSIDPFNGVLSNDTDQNSCDILQIQPLDPPSFGGVVLNSDGSFDYTHDDSENFIDEFKYLLNDGECSVWDTVTVTIRIDPVPDTPPVALPDSFPCIDEGGFIQMVLSEDGVLSNDYDVDTGQTLNAVLVEYPLHGTLILNPNGTFIYTHDGGESTSDSFTYYVEDDTGLTSQTVSVKLCINPVNDCPVPVDDIFTINEGEIIDSTLIFNDFDVEGNDLLINITTPPSLGGFSWNQDGTFTYSAPDDIPAPGPEIVTFEYMLTDVVDGFALCDSTATVTIIVNYENDCPVVSDDSIIVDGSSANSRVISVLDNDYDPDSEIDTTSVKIISGPKFGDAISNIDGTITYNYDESPIPFDTITYSVSDYEGCEKLGKIYIYVENLRVPKYKLPNYFTPNGDDFNDFFLIKYENILIEDMNFEVKIYDRYQRLIHESFIQSSDKVWNGMNIDSSGIVKTDFYFYEITPVEYYNTPYVRRRDKLVGTVYLEKER